jgi:hypothetical protein
MTRRLRWAALAATAVVVMTGTTPADAGDQATGPYTGYPDSMVVLAHSGATGENSGPKPGVEVRRNSWATGTNPKVDSVYRRILAKNPRIKGNSDNLARAGANIEALQAQAAEAVTLRPAPELVLVQIMDNDMVCPATRRDYRQFKAGFVDALETIAEGLPRARIFVVSQFGSPSTYLRVLTREERLQFGGTGPCAFLGPDGAVVPRELERLERIIRNYEARLESGCEEVAQCTYDEGAFGRIRERRAYFSSDLNHLSVRGHAKAAEVAWRAMRRAGLVPVPDE